MNTLRRVLPVKVKIRDESKGLVEYIASDESLDSYREVVRVSGWRFNYFEKNAPFVDSHDYSSIEKKLGSVVGWEVRGGELRETVQWAKEITDSKAIQIGWKMTLAGHPPAVSVGFVPLDSVSRFGGDAAAYAKELKDLGYKTPEEGPHTIYREQEQVELSAVILGANRNAVARCYHSGAINDAELDWLSRNEPLSGPISTAAYAADAEEIKRQHREDFFRAIEQTVKKLRQ